MSTNSADVVAGTNALAEHYNDLRADVLTGRKNEIEATDGATITFNLANGSVQEVTLGGNRTLAVANDNDYQCFILILRQDGTGSRIPTWWNNIKWQDNVEPTLATGANEVDVIGFIRISSTEYLGFVIAQRMA